MSARLVKYNALSGEDDEPKTLVSVQEEKWGIINGIIKDWNGKPAKNAVVKLYEISYDADEYALNPITLTFSDENGEFAFGPLNSNEEYVVKIWFENAKVNQFIISPEKYYVKPKKCRSTAINEQLNEYDGLCNDYKPFPPDETNDHYYDDYGHGNDEEDEE